MGESLARGALTAGSVRRLTQDGIAGTNGLLAGTNLANHAAAAVRSTSYANYVSQFAFTAESMGGSRPTPSDLKILLGSDDRTRTRAAVYRANEYHGLFSAVDRLMSRD